MRRPIERLPGRRWWGRVLPAVVLAGLWLVAAGMPAGAHARVVARSGRWRVLRVAS